VSGSLAVASLHQVIEAQSVVQVRVFSSLAQEILGHLLVCGEEVLLEGAVSSFLEVLVLDVLQVGSLLGRVDIFSAGLDGLSLGLDAINDIFSSGADFIHEGGLLADLVSDELVIGTGFKSFTAESGVVHEDSLEVLESILAGVAHDSEVESGVVGTGENEALVSTGDVESSHKGVSPIVELEDKSVVILEVEDREGSHGSEDGSVTSHFLDFSFFEEEDFDTLDHAV